MGSILKSRLDRFRKSLGCYSLLRIHHYNSLSLLNQEIFTRTRPNSRLAEEYIRLCKNIREANSEDKEGAVGFLKSLNADPYQFSITEALDRIKKIEGAHAEGCG